MVLSSENCSIKMNIIELKWLYFYVQKDIKSIKCNRFVTEFCYK